MYERERVLVLLDLEPRPGCLRTTAEVGSRWSALVIGAYDGWHALPTWRVHAPTVYGRMTGLGRRRGYRMRSRVSLRKTGNARMIRMSQPESHDDHFQLRLGLFVLGALPLDEHLAVEEHVAQCPSCRAECDELSEVPALLSLLSEEDIRTLAEEFAPARGRRGVAADSPPVTALVFSDLSPPSTPHRRPKYDISGPRRQAGRTRGVRRRVAAALPSGGRRRLVLAAIMVTLAAGVGMGAWLQTSGAEPAQQFRAQRCER